MNASSKQTNNLTDTKPNKRTITFYESFAALQQEEDNYSRKLTPQECIQESVLLIRTLYRHELSKPSAEKKINFRKNL